MATAAVFTRVLLCSAFAEADDTRAVLNQAGWQVETRAPAEFDPELAREFDVLVLDGGADDRDLWRACRSCRATLTDCFVPILATTSDASVRKMSLEAGADACFVRPFDAGELHAQVKAFLRLKRLHDRVRERTSEFHRANKRLRQAYQQVDQELGWPAASSKVFYAHAARIVGRRFAVITTFRRVGGDLRRLRLDETHAGFYVADVVGHGVPPVCLPCFGKGGAKEIVGSEYHLTAPDDVLHHLNRRC